MITKDSTVLILGAGGMVGTAVCREILKEKPAKMVLCSLRKEEVDEAVKTMLEELNRQKTLDKYEGPLREEEYEITFEKEWGNIFVREGLHQLDFPPVEDPEYRKMLIEDTIGDFGDGSGVAGRYFIYNLIKKHKPQIIIDCINTATAIAYQNIFKTSSEVFRQLQQDNLSSESVERLLCSLYVPQLIRHVQVLYKAMIDFDTRTYVKVGTSGTGGMGLNIPYTHGEERPSRVLLSKSAVGGAHTLLLMLLSRTPNAPAAKEIKPTAAIAWKRIGYGVIGKGDRKIKLQDVDPDEIPYLEDSLDLGDPSYPIIEKDKYLKATYIDTGENGLFSVGEFTAITTAGQMEYVTPEEIARNIVSEIKGTNTGKDVLTALSTACMDPSYRAGFMRNGIIEKLRRIQLEKELAENNHLVCAFELLGPPRLSKLLYEAYLLKLAYGTITNVAEADHKDMMRKLRDLIYENSDLRSRIISIGIPILVPKRRKLKLIRGTLIKTPPSTGEKQVSVNSEKIDEWAKAGWVDLRTSNMKLWKQRMRAILKEIALLPTDDTSSRYIRNRWFWTKGYTRQWEIDIGEIAGWIFITEDQGERGKE